MSLCRCSRWPTRASRSAAAFLAQAFTSPVTLGILAGYVLGKPLGITGTSFLVTRLSRGRLRPPVGWASIIGAGTIAGIGFTVSLLIASLAFTGPELAEAKVGVLAAAVCAAILTSIVFRVTGLLPKRARIRALFGTSQVIVDLAVPVDPDRDHIRGPMSAPVTVVEYGDFECPYCGRAEPAVRALLADFGDVRYVWRHLPLTDVHPHAQLAAEASEAAGEQDSFWEMHDLLLDHQDALKPADLMRLCRPRSGSTWSGSPVTCASTTGAGGWPRTSTRPTSAPCPARPPSSSTASAITAPTTSTRFRRPPRRPGRRRRSPADPVRPAARRLAGIP